MCIRYKDKVTTVAAAGPSCLFRPDVPDSHQYFYNKKQEREAKGQEREIWKETRHAQMLAAF